MHQALSKVFLVLGLGGFFTGSSASGSVETVQAEEDSGSVRTFDDSYPFDGQVELLWSVLTDYDNIHTFQPGILESRLIGPNEEGETFLEQTMVQGFLVFKRKLKLRLKLDTQPQKRVDFVIEEGEFDIYEGSWIIDTSESTPQLRLVLRVDPAFAAPGPVLNHIVQTSGKKSLRSIIDEAYRRQKQSSGEQ